MRGRIRKRKMRKMGGSRRAKHRRKRSRGWVRWEERELGIEGKRGAGNKTREEQGGRKKKEGTY